MLVMFLVVRENSKVLKTGKMKKVGCEIMRILNRRFDSYLPDKMVNVFVGWVLSNSHFSIYVDTYPTFV